MRAANCLHPSSGRGSHDRPSPPTHTIPPTDQPDVLAVIIGRAGSKGLPKKNELILAGKPMICHSIAHAQAAETVSLIVVSTDGSNIAAAAEKMNVTVIKRPADLATDTTPVDNVVRHAVETIGSNNSIIVILYANVPIRPVDLIDRAVSKLIKTGADSVQSYCPVGKHHPHWMVSLDDSDKVTPHVTNTTYRRQDLPPLWLPDGGVIAVTRSSLFTVVPGQPHAFLGSDRRGIINNPGTVIDIDDAHDFALAESILTTQHNPNPAEITPCA